jgi:hypothetical protein
MNDSHESREQLDKGSCRSKRLQLHWFLWLMLFLIFRSGRKAGSYLFTSADDADDAGDADNADDAEHSLQHLHSYTINSSSHRYYKSIVRAKAKFTTPAILHVSQESCVVGLKA